MKASNYATDQDRDWREVLYRRDRGADDRPGLLATQGPVEEVVLRLLR